ncbi:MAG: chromate efflux transporter [Burkholderiales bacterium]|nr:chromate efflux transporter [Burkholderiales bacterium]
MTSGGPMRHTITFDEAFRFWLKLGFISFGGPAGQIAIMHRELVEQRRWISEGRFLHALNYCMLLPGPEAQQLATYIGWLMHRTWGGIVAGALFVLPSFVLLIILSWVYVRFGDLPWVAGILHGIKPAVVAIVLHAAWRIGTRALKNPWSWGIAVAAFSAIALLGVPFPLIILGAAAIGALAGGRLTANPTDQHRKGTAAAGGAVIDDDTPTPAHASYSSRRLAITIGTGLLLWALPLVLIAASVGWAGTPMRMGWFFTKAALLTFGGAYAVLPYVYQGAVSQFHWLTAAQMIDGLALGETTPGPLIMIVTFVGFVGGWNQADTTFTLGAAIAGASVATYFTFLPSFIFILTGGPVIESTHRTPRWKAPLTAITAAVVGVIVNLAIVFGEHVFLPAGAGQPADWIAIALFVVAAVALFRFRIGVVPLIGAFGAIGLSLQWFVQ